jgi:hypothetical protein
MPSWWKTLKARKEHTCIVCRKSIHPGAVYVKYTKQEGDGFVNLKMHNECEDAFDKYMDDLDAKVELVERESLVDPLEFAEPDDFYEDENGSFQYGV